MHNFKLFNNIKIKQLEGYCQGRRDFGEYLDLRKRDRSMIISVCKDNTHIIPDFAFDIVRGVVAAEPAPTVVVWVIFM